VEDYGVPLIPLMHLRCILYGGDTLLPWLPSTVAVIVTLWKISISLCSMKTTLLRELRLYGYSLRYCAVVNTCGDCCYSFTWVLLVIVTGPVVRWFDSTLVPWFSCVDYCWWLPFPWLHHSRAWSRYSFVGICPSFYFGICCLWNLITFTLFDCAVVLRGGIPIPIVVDWWLLFGDIADYHFTDILRAVPTGDVDLFWCDAVMIWWPFVIWMPLLFCGVDCWYIWPVVTIRCWWNYYYWVIHYWPLFILIRCPRFHIGDLHLILIVPTIRIEYCSPSAICCLLLVMILLLR